MNLRIIYLWKNKIRYIDRLLFSKNTKLKYIDLSENLIRLFELDLKPLIDLNRLDLSNNMLTTFNKNVFEVLFVNLTRVELNIDNNKFICDYKMHWVRELEITINIDIKVLHTDKCQNNNITIHCWFNISKDVCQPLNSNRSGKG